MANVEIYTRNLCWFCDRARKLLNARGIPFREYNASHEPDRRAEMIERSGRKTFPQVFIDGRHIGGSDDLVAFDRSGELERTLAKAS
ncbi:MAG: glutaredoxin 3 [Pseudomonadota bacterium]